MADPIYPADPAWLDRMYNNRARVPDHPANLARWAEASAQVRRTAACTLDIAYGTAPGEKLDVFAPDTAGKWPPTAGAPVVVLIHGGYWRALDKSDHSFIAPPLTSSGVCVVVPNYDLCPAVTIPEITMQMVRALAWTWRHIADHGGDPSRITVVGHSAGGQLAAMLLNALWPAYARDLPPTVVKNALSLSGLHDLTPLAHTPHMKDVLRLTPQAVRQASPALLPRPRQGVLHCAVGGDESEEFLRQNRLIQQAWGRKAVPVCEVLPGLNHFTIVEALAEPTHRLHHMLRALLA